MAASITVEVSIEDIANWEEMSVSADGGFQFDLWEGGHQITLWFTPGSLAAFIEHAAGMLADHPHAGTGVPNQ